MVVVGGGGVMLYMAVWFLDIMDPKVGSEVTEQQGSREPPPTAVFPHAHHADLKPGCEACQTMWLLQESLICN